MSAFIVEWAVEMGSGLSTLSRRYSDLVCGVRPLGFRWVVRCSGPKGSLESLQHSRLWDASSITFGDRTESSLIFAYAPTLTEHRLLRQIATGGGFVLPPILLQGGTLRVRFLSSSGAPPRSGTKGVVPARLVSRRRLATSDLREELIRQAPDWPLLTRRQTEVLLEAVHAGYYEVPRRSDVLEIARHLSLGRSTVEEHLRAAESAVIQSAIGLVEASRTDGETAGEVEPLEHFAQFSSELDLYVDLALRGNRVTRVQLLREAPPPVERRAHPILARILDHIRTGQDDLRDVSVDLRVSPFERRVLEELRRIPLGQTRTYAEVARRLGEPDAARAVGNACARNPAVVLIPCHRVVPTRGGIGQYSAEGGPETKRRLLALEGAIPKRSPPTRHREREHAR